MSWIARIVLAGTLVGSAGCHAPLSAPEEQNVVADSAIPRGFSQATAEVNGARIFYLRGGSGPPVVLIHGFPQDHTAWREVAPRLAERYTVIIPDLRGIGRSTSPPAGPYDAATLAGDIRQLLATTGLGSPYVVGHDMGGLVAFAYAAAHPTEVRGAMLIENPLPGLPGWEEIAGIPEVWHINFHQAPDMPELLIRGHEAAYFRSQFFGPAGGGASAVDDSELARYAAAYARPEQLKAGLGQYRATPQNAEFNRAIRAPTNGPPLTLVATEGSLDPTMAQIENALEAKGWNSIERVTLPGRGHYLMDETPEAIAALIMTAAAP